MTNEGERPRSSWQSWVRSSAARRATPPAAPSAPAGDDLDLELEWSAEEPSEGGGEATEALDAGLAWPSEAQAADEGEAADPDGGEAADPDGGDAGGGGDVEDIVDEAFEYAAEEGEDENGELLPAVPLLPSIAGRVEALSGLLRSISMRIDGLTAVTDVYRASVADRIDEYTETVLQLSRQADQALDEHRRSSERAIGELRRSAGDRSEAIGQLLGRVEELATDVATLRDLVEVLIDTIPASAEGSGAPPLTRADLDEAVGSIADAVVARLDTDAIVDAVVARMEQAFEVVGDAGATPAPAPSPAPAPPVEEPLAGDLFAPKRGGRVRRGR